MTGSSAQLVTGEGFRRALLGSMREAVLVEKAERIVFANGACLSMLGAARPEEILGRPVRFFFARERDPNTPCDDAGLEVWRLEGTVIPAAVSSTPFEDGAEGAVLFVIQNLSERHRAEAEQHASDALY